MEFKFTNEIPASRTDEVIEYLAGPRLWIPSTDYPDFLQWAQKAHGELRSGVKRAMVAYHGREIAGVTIYQRHKEYPDALELKNITVRPDARGRYVASFLLRNTEIEGGLDFGVQHIVCDSKAGNVGIKRFLRRHHYRIVGQADLYTLGAGEDIIYRKPILQRRIQD